MQPNDPVRPYQQQAIASVSIRSASGPRPARHANWLRQDSRFSEITRMASEHKMVVVILVHRRELINQASDKLKKAGVEHGIIAAGFPKTNPCSSRLGSNTGATARYKHFTPAYHH